MLSLFCWGSRMFAEEVGKLSVSPGRRTLASFASHELEAKHIHVTVQMSFLVAVVGLLCMHGMAFQLWKSCWLVRRTATDGDELGWDHCLFSTTSAPEAS